MNEAKAQQLQQLMTGLVNSDAGKEILKAAKVNEFYAVTEADFDKVKEIVAFALGETY